MLLALLVLAAAPADARLVGTWQLNGQPFVTLNANGSGVMEDDRITWKVEGTTLVIVDEDGEAERLPFQVAGEQLTVKAEGATLTLTRGGAAVKKGGAVARAAAKAKGGDAEAEALAEAQAWAAKQPGRGGEAAAPVRQAQPPQRAGGDQLSRLLLSSNWCWIRYASGNSYTQKVHFSPDGTWQDFSESDISVNNQYAQVTAQATGNRQGGGRWAVRNGQLLLSSPEAPELAPVPLSITQNSNGYPIINADGREYSQCN